MSEADVTKVAVAAAGATAGEAVQGDERLAYRGVFQRLLVRPEIGAAIAAVAVWIFFWAVSVPFGKAGGAASILDVASSPLGIMAVAVAMLMIGGEFDLSSGAATGAFGILMILMVRDVVGDVAGGNLSLWLALPASLLFALGLGWFNGTMVNRTSLPSFIVTLGSFFILKGAKLGFSKLIVDQIQVGKLNDLQINAEATGESDKGYGILRKVFAAEWQRNDHIWQNRDWLYSIGIFVGLTLLVLAVYELQFARKSRMNPVGIGVLFVGILGAILGVWWLHNTDDVTGNWIGAGIIGGSMLVGFYGWCLWRYRLSGRSSNTVTVVKEDQAGDGSSGLSAGAVAMLGAGIVSVVLAVVAALAFDPNNSENVSWLVMVTEQGLRAILFIGLASAGAVFLLIAASRARKTSQMMGSSLLMLTALAVAGMAFFIRSESGTPKFRTQAFTVMLAIAGVMFVWSIMSMLFEERRYPDVKADRLGRMIALAGVVGLVTGLVARLMFIIPEEADGPLTKFSVRILWFIGFTAVCTWVLGRTKFGSWTFAVGGNKQASRQVGVPAARTKTQLFMLVSFAAWLVGMLLAFRLNTIQASTGDGEEFEYIIAAVVGGTALTGGYGSTLGAAIGAIIMAMAVQGIPSSRWNSDWRFVFVGAILLLAVIGNNFIRAKAEASR